MATSRNAKVIRQVATALADSSPETPRQSILDQASAIVHGDRNVAYGNPEDNFANIAGAWNVYLHAKGFVGMISAADVPIMMILMKTARLATNPTHHDSCVDVAGYAACLGDIQHSMCMDQKNSFDSSAMLGAETASMLSTSQLAAQTERVRTNRK